MTTEQKLNNELDGIYEAFERTLPKKRGQAIEAVNRSRLTLADVLAKHADTSGKIPRNKTSVVLRDLAQVEGEIYRNLRNELRTIIYDSSEYATSGISEALVALIGIPTIVATSEMVTAGIALDAITTEAFIALMLGISALDFIGTIVDSVFRRIGDDGRNLNERLRILAKLLTDELSTILRQSIRNGEGIDEIMRKVNRRFREADWRIETLVETESLNALRQSTARLAEVSGVVKALRIVDYPHGEPGEHARHKCHVYAHANEHGMGAGVYPVTTRKIRNPHPRCRSTLHLVLADSLS